MLIFDSHPESMSRRAAIPLALIAVLISMGVFADQLVPLDYRSYNLQRIWAAGVMTVGLGVWLARLKPESMSFGVTRAHVLIAVFFLFGLAAAMCSRNARLALHEWASFLLLLVVASAIAKCVRANPQHALHLAVLVSGVAVILYLLRVLVTYILFLTDSAAFEPADLIVGFDNYRFFNHVQTIAIPLLALLVFRGRGGLRLCWAFVLALNWALVFLTAGRGTFLGIAAAALVVASLVGRRSYPVLTVISATAILGLILHWLLFQLVPVQLGADLISYANQVADRSIANPLSARDILWKESAALLLLHPVLGIGPVHFASHAAQSGLSAHPHNWVLQVGSEWGIPALLAITCATVLAFQKLLAISRLTRGNSSESATGTILVLTGLAIMIDGLVSGLIVTPLSQLWVALYVGCAWGWTEGHRSSAQLTPLANHRASIKVQRPIVALAMVVVLLAYWNGLLPELLLLPELEDSVLRAGLYRSGEFHPRVWLSGYF